MTNLACCLALAVLAAACSGGSTKKADSATSGGGDVSAGSDSGSSSGGGVSSGGLALSAGASAEGAGVPGLSVRGVATGTAAADQAFVVVIPSGATNGDLLGGPGVRAQDRSSVLNALAAAGVAKTDVSFDPDTRTGQPRVQVKLAVNQVATKGPGIVTTVERTLGRSLSSGVSFALASCDPAAAPLRKQALADADAQAKALADAGKLNLGGIVAVRQESDAIPLRFAAPAAGCSLVAADQLSGFDAKPEVKLTLALDVTYGLGGAPAAGTPARPLLWSLGTATAKAGADQAYVGVLFSSDDSDPSAGPTTDKRNQVFDALGKLKIDRKDVTIASRSDYGITTIVQVKTKADGLAGTGKDIVRAVEDVLGRSDSSGARFWSSNCGSVLAKARKDAVADGRQRAGALADAAGVKLGNLQAVSEISLAGIDPCDASIDALLDASDSGSSPLQPFDADAQFTLTTSAQLGFLIA